MDQSSIATRDQNVYWINVKSYPLMLKDCHQNTVRIPKDGICRGAWWEKFQERDHPHHQNRKTGFLRRIKEEEIPEGQPIAASCDDTKFWLMERAQRGDLRAVSIRQGEIPSASPSQSSVDQMTEIAKTVARETVFGVLGQLGIETSQDIDALRALLGKDKPQESSLAGGEGKKKKRKLRRPGAIINVSEIEDGDDE